MKKPEESIDQAIASNELDAFVTAQMERIHQDADSGKQDNENPFEDIRSMYHFLLTKDFDPLEFNRFKEQFRSSLIAITTDITFIERRKRIESWITKLEQKTSEDMEQRRVKIRICQLKLQLREALAEEFPSLIDNAVAACLHEDNQPKSRTSVRELLKTYPIGIRPLAKEAKMLPYDLWLLKEGYLRCTVGELKRLQICAWRLQKATGEEDYDGTAIFDFLSDPNNAPGLISSLTPLPPEERANIVVDPGSLKGDSRGDPENAPDKKEQISEVLVFDEGWIAELLHSKRVEIEAIFTRQSVGEDYETKMDKLRSIIKGEIRVKPEILQKLRDKISAACEAILLRRNQVKEEVKDTDEVLLGLIGGRSLCNAYCSYVLTRIKRENIKELRSITTEDIRNIVLNAQACSPLVFNTLQRMANDYSRSGL